MLPIDITPEMLVQKPVLLLHAQHFAGRRSNHLLALIRMFN
jgi:hypothetical protein